MLPRSSQPTPTTLSPAMTALAGLVPWAETGIRQTSRWLSPQWGHGTRFTLALVRFPPTATNEFQYLNAKAALPAPDTAGYPVLHGNFPPRELSVKGVFRS